MINISIYNPSILNETKDQKNTYITSNHKQGSLKKHCTFHWTVAAVTGLQPALLCKSCEIFHKGKDFSDVFWKQQASSIPSRCGSRLAISPQRDQHLPATVEIAPAALETRPSPRCSHLRQARGFLLSLFQAPIHSLDLEAKP